VDYSTDSTFPVSPEDRVYAFSAKRIDRFSVSVRAFRGKKILTAFVATLATQIRGLFPVASDESAETLTLNMAVAPARVQYDDNPGGRLTTKLPNPIVPR
jgi:hypothetical protein